MTSARSVRACRRLWADFSSLTERHGRRGARCKKINKNIITIIEIKNNKMEKKIIFSIALTLFFMSGCIPEGIDIDVKPAESRIAVSSKIIPLSYMFVSLTKSYSPLDPITTGVTVDPTDLNKFLVSNALVTVSYNNQIDTLGMLTPGIYTSTNTLLTNYNTYTLNVTEPSTGQQVSAVTTMLPQVQFDTVYPVIIKNATDTAVIIKYVLNDNPNEENFYVVNYILKQSSVGASLDISSYFSMGSNKVLSTFDLLDDASFTNNSLTKESVLPLSPTDIVVVEVANISKGYYEFLTAFKRTGNILNSLEAEPIHFPTNVQNGYGYFNAYYPYSKMFDLSQY